jgi:hypothetical protein
VIKRQFGFQKTRLRGLAKNSCKINVLAALTNLFLPGVSCWRQSEQGDGVPEREDSASITSTKKLGMSP